MRTPTLSHAAALDRLRAVAAKVVESSDPEAVARFMERISLREDSDELRAALVLAGASAVLATSRGRAVPHAVSPSAESVEGVADPTRRGPRVPLMARSVV